MNYCDISHSKLHGLRTVYIHFLVLLYLYEITAGKMGGGLMNGLFIRGSLKVVNHNNYLIYKNYFS